MGKCTSAVSLPNQIEFWCRACVFLRSEKRGISFLCNWRLGRGAGAQRLGDYGKMSLSWTFSSLISHFAIYFFSHYITLHIFFEHVSREQQDLFIQRFRFVCFFNHWVYKMPYCMLLFYYKKPALYNLLKHYNRSAAVDVPTSCICLWKNVHHHVYRYHVDRWLMDAVDLSVSYIKVILWECP